MTTDEAATDRIAGGGNKPALWSIDRLGRGLSLLAMLLLGFGADRYLLPAAGFAAAAAVTINFRRIKLDVWCVAFLAATIGFYVLYRAAYITPELMPEGSLAPSLRLYVPAVACVILAFLMVAASPSRRAKVDLVVAVSLGMLAKAFLILVATLPIRSPPFYGTGGFDPLMGGFVNSSTVAELATFSAWSLIIFVLCDSRGFRRSERIAAILLLSVSVTIGVMFGSRTYFLLVALATGGMATAYLYSAGVRGWNWRAISLIVGGLLLLNAFAALAIDAYRAGLLTLIGRFAENGLSSQRFQLYADWFSQFVGNPLDRPVVDLEGSGTYWFHNLWMDVHATSGLGALLLSLVLCLIPLVRVVSRLWQGDREAWPSLVAYACVLLLLSTSVALGGANWGALAYLSALSALILVPPGEAPEVGSGPSNAGSRTIRGIQSITRHAGVRRYFFNTTWLMGEQVLRLLVGLLIGVYVARYLGPERFGIYSYVVAFVAIFGSVAALGLETIVVRNLVERPHERDEILGTSLLLRLAGGLAAFLAMLLALPWIGNDTTTNIYIAIVGLGVVFQAFGVVDGYFQSIVQGKYAAICKITQLALTSCFRLVLVFLDADLFWFMVAALVDQISLGAAYLFVSWRKNVMPDIRTFANSTARNLVRESWPLMISGVAVLLYMRIDQVMIKSLLGEEEVGFYAAAVRIVEIAYFVPVVLAASLFPRIVSSNQRSEASLRDSTLLFFELMSILAWLGAIVLFLLHDVIVVLLFGPAFADAAPVVAVSAWASIFVFSGVAASQWAIAKNLTRQAMVRTLLGAGLNIALNLILIPRYGIMGAAVATLISQGIASVGLNLVMPSMRECFFLQVRAILLPGAHIASTLSLRFRGA